MFRRAFAALLALGFSSVLTSPAEARPYNDVEIFRPCPGGAPCADWLTEEEYRKFIMELGLLISPKVMAPSSTLGFNGFDFGLEANTGLIHGQERYWTNATRDGSIPRVFTFPTLRVRKGLPLSLEGGMNVSYLPFTQQQVIGGDFRFAAHEGFSLVPDTAIQISYNQFIGNDQLDMNVVQGSACLGYTWAFGEIPGIHTGRLSAWGGFSKGIINSRVNSNAISPAYNGPLNNYAFMTALGLEPDGRLRRNYNKWVVGVQVESGGFTYLVDGEFVDSAIPTINMRWGAQF